MDFYGYQRRDYGIGNFINCTPIIQTLYHYFKEPIPIYFESNHVKEMFEKWECIIPINKDEAENTKLLFASNMVNKEIPDWQYIHNCVTRELQIPYYEIPHTYVDSYDPPDDIKDKKYAVIIHGGINNEWVGLKQIDNEVYLNIIDKIKDKFDIVFIGSDSDRKRIYPLLESLEYKYLYFNDIKNSIGVINGANIVVSNDTGMCHVAGAFKKNTFVLWKNTNWNKNRSPNPNCFYSFIGNWYEDFDNWIKKFI